MIETLWCVTHEAVASPRYGEPEIMECWVPATIKGTSREKDGTVVSIRDHLLAYGAYDAAWLDAPCFPKPMVLVPKEAPSITVTHASGHPHVLGEWTEAAVPAGVYVWRGES